MSFRDLLALQSVRDYEDKSVGSVILNDIRGYLEELNTTVGKKKGFHLYYWKMD